MGRGTLCEPRPSSHDCSYFLRYGPLRELECLTDSGVVQCHIVARRAADKPEGRWRTI
jgi:hypothetical protein